MNAQVNISSGVVDSPVDFSALFSVDQLMKAEQEDANGLSRRLTLSVLTRSKSELVEMINNIDTDAFEELLDQVEACQQYIAAMKEMADAAFARLMVAAKEVIDEIDEAQASEGGDQ
jgi:hypothetical protein